MFIKELSHQGLHRSIPGIDQEPKKLTADQERALQILAKQVITQLELRIHTRQVERINEQREKMFAVVAHDLRSPFNGIMGMSKILRSKAEKLVNLLGETTWNTNGKMVVRGE